MSTIITDVSIRYFNHDGEPGGKPDFLMHLKAHDSNSPMKAVDLGMQVVGSYFDLGCHIGKILSGIHAGHFLVKGKSGVLAMLDKFKAAFNTACAVAPNTPCHFSLSDFQDLSNDDIDTALKALLTAKEFSMFRKEMCETKETMESLYCQGSLSRICLIAKKMQDSKAFGQCLQMLKIDDSVIAAESDNAWRSYAKSLRVKMEIPVLRVGKLKQIKYAKAHCYLAKVDSKTFFTTNLASIYFSHIFPIVFVSGTFASAKRHVETFLDFYNEINSRDPDNHYRYIVQGFVPSGNLADYDANALTGTLPQSVEVCDDSNWNDIQLLEVLLNLNLTNWLSLPHKFPKTKRLF